MFSKPKRLNVSRDKEGRLRGIACSLTLVVLFLSALAVLGGQAAPRHSSNWAPPLLAIDPGPRGGPPGAGTFIRNLTTLQRTVAVVGQGQFQATHNVTGTGEIGLGPRFDSNSCSSCHSTPAVGGSAPTSNPLFAVYQLNGAQNSMPFFETASGPPLTARFQFQPNLLTPDGNVHQLFVITGRTDAGTCSIAQPDFVTAASQNNLFFRQPSPTFGAGMLELILDSDIIANMNANGSQKQALGISGHPNLAEDGSIARFGWKAQHRSAIIASFEQLNVEMGVTNESLPDELDETSGCVLNPVPEDHTNFSATSFSTFTGDAERLAIFMRFLDQPKPAPSNPSIRNGQTVFGSIGCILCHTQSFTTPSSSVRALTKIVAKPFSDLLVHHMGPCLADNIVQGAAGGDEFRTAPLWGAGQRIFFLHDGRTSDVVQAIEDHFCTGNSQYPDSEANGVVGAFNNLSAKDQQDLINFLRAL